LTDGHFALWHLGAMIQTNLPNVNAGSVRKFAAYVSFISGKLVVTGQVAAAMQAQLGARASNLALDL
jgi:hypothetical protein